MAHIVIMVTRSQLWKLTVVIVTVATGWLISFKTAQGAVDILVPTIGVIAVIELWAWWIRRFSGDRAD